MSDEVKIDWEDPRVVNAFLRRRGYDLPGPHILVMREKAETTTASGIILQQDSVPHLRHGIVVLVGHDLKRKIEVFDNLALQKYEPTTVEIRDRAGSRGKVLFELEIMEERDCLLRYPSGYEMPEEVHNT